MATVEADIDRDMTPRSAALKGWTVNLEVKMKRDKLPLRNVIGVLEGKGPLANETIFVGTTPGLEGVLAEELEELGFPGEPTSGGVTIEGPKGTYRLINLVTVLQPLLHHRDLVLLGNLDALAEEANILAGRAVRYERGHRQRLRVMPDHPLHETHVRRRVAWRVLRRRGRDRDERERERENEQAVSERFLHEFVD